MSKTDRELGMDREITRRDFLNGTSVAIGGASAVGATGLAASTARASESAGAAWPDRRGARGVLPAAAHGNAWQP